jgi:hypothetical protein
MGLWRFGHTQTEIDESVLKGMLPVVAPMMMGAMSKQAAQPAGLQAGTVGGGDPDSLVHSRECRLKARP